MGYLTPESRLQAAELRAVLADGLDPARVEALYTAVSGLPAADFWGYPHEPVPRALNERSWAVHRALHADGLPACRAAFGCDQPGHQIKHGPLSALCWDALAATATPRLDHALTAAEYHYDPAQDTPFAQAAAHRDKARARMVPILRAVLLAPVVHGYADTTNLDELWQLVLTVLEMTDTQIATVQALAAGWDGTPPELLQAARVVAA